MLGDAVSGDRKQNTVETFSPMVFNEKEFEKRDILFENRQVRSLPPYDTLAQNRYLENITLKAGARSRFSPLKWHASKVRTQRDRPNMSFYLRLDVVIVRFFIYFTILLAALLLRFSLFFSARAQYVSGANRETACTCTLPHVRLTGKIITPQLLCARRPAKEHGGGRGYGARARPSRLTISAADRGRPEISIVNNRRARNTDTQAYGSGNVYVYICIAGINLHYAGAI